MVVNVTNFLGNTIPVVIKVTNRHGKFTDCFAEINIVLFRKIRRLNLAEVLLDMKIQMNVEFGMKYHRFRM